MVAYLSYGQLVSSGDDFPLNYHRPNPGVPLMDYAPGAVDIDALRKHPSVRKVTDFIARSVASIPLHLYQRSSDTDRVRVTGTPLAHMLKEPAPRVTPSRFWRDVMMDRLLWDKFCLVPVEKDDNIQLTRIPARKFNFVADGLGQITDVEVNLGSGETEIIPVDQAIIDVGFSPTGCNGLSPLETLSNLLLESEEAVDYRRQVWQRGARVPSVVTRPAPDPGKGQKEWPKHARRNFLNQLEDYKHNGAKSGAILLLEDGMQFSSTNMFSPEQLLDLEGRKLVDTEVAAAFHVPPELVGAREGTYSNIEAFRQMVYREVCGPWIKGIEEALNTQLVPLFNEDDNLYIEANIESALRGAFQENAKIGQTAVGAPFMTRNEWRARMNMPAMPGGDELVTPLNVLIGGQASPTDVDGRPPEEVRDA